MTDILSNPLSRSMLNPSCRPRNRRDADDSTELVGNPPAPNEKSDKDSGPADRVAVWVFFYHLEVSIRNWWRFSRRSFSVFLGSCGEFGRVFWMTGLWDGFSGWFGDGEGLVFRGLGVTGRV